MRRYEAFVRDPSCRTPVYEIPGAREVAIEFTATPRTAGFTGLRCAYTVVPKECIAWDDSGQRRSPACAVRCGGTRPVQRRVLTPCNAPPRPVYGAEGQQQVRALIDGYLDNARTIPPRF